MKHHEGIRSYDHTAAALAFPLGGVGTGNVSLGARGELRDWEIFNLPSERRDHSADLLRAPLPASGARAQSPCARRSDSSAAHPVAWLPSPDELGGLAALQRRDFPRAIPLRQHRFSRCEHAGLGFPGSLYALAAAQSRRFRHSLRYPDLHRQQPDRRPGRPHRRRLTDQPGGEAATRPVRQRSARRVRHSRQQLPR